MLIGKFKQTFGIHEFYRPEKVTLKLSFPVLPRRGYKVSDLIYVWPSEIFLEANGGMFNTSIIAVHGLHGDGKKTWTTDNSKICWLKDLLPQYFKTAAILSYGYNANVSSLNRDARSKSDVEAHAVSMVANLYAYRALEGLEDCPIIYLCHSLGGIVVKKALAYAATRTHPRVRHVQQVLTKTVGILFFGTPHLGSAKANQLVAIQKVISRTISERLLAVRPHLARILYPGSQVLKDIADDFAPLMPRILVFNFWEMKKTNLVYTRDYIVEKWSAAPDCPGMESAGIMADHRGVCKFESHQSPGFQMVVNVLRRYSAIARRRAALETEHKLTDTSIQEQLEEMAELEMWIKLNRKVEDEGHDHENCLFTEYGTSNERAAFGDGHVPIRGTVAPKETKIQTDVEYTKTEDNERRRDVLRSVLQYQFWAERPPHRPPQAGFGRAMVSLTIVGVVFLLNILILVLMLPNNN